MKPARFLIPLSTFLMRLGVLFFIYVNYFGTVLKLNLKQVDFYLGAIVSIFGVLLFIGTFIHKQTLTVLSALILFLFSIYMGGLLMPY